MVDILTYPRTRRNCICNIVFISVVMIVSTDLLAQLPATSSSVPQQLSPQMQTLFNQPAVQIAPYFGIGVDDMDCAQYEALGTNLDWGQGKCPGGGVIVSFVEPGGEAFQKGIRWGDILLGVDIGGTAKNITLAQGLFLQAGHLKEGQKATFHIFQAGKVATIHLVAQPWPQKALEIWPRDSPKGAFHFPFMKEQEKLVNYRVKEYQDRQFRNSDPLLLKGIADIYLLTGHFALAIENYDAFLEETAKNPEIPRYPALYAKAYAYRCLGEFDKARRSAENAVSDRPKSVLALFEWSQALNGLGQPEAALKCIDNAISLTQPSNTALMAYFQDWRSKINVVPPAMSAQSSGFQGPKAFVPTLSSQAPLSPTPAPSTPPGILLGLYPSPASHPAMAPVQQSQGANQPARLALPTEPVSQPAQQTLPGLALAIQEVKTLLPASPGEHIVIVVDYQVSGIPATQKMDIQERVYLNTDKARINIWEWTSSRGPGASRLNFSYGVPLDMKPGSYQLEAQISSGQSMAKKTSMFVVKQ